MGESFPYANNPNYQEYDQVASTLASADPSVPGSLSTALQKAAHTLEDVGGPVKSALADLANDWTGTAATTFQKYGSQLAPAAEVLRLAFADSSMTLDTVSKAMDYGKQATASLQSEIESIYQDLSALSSQVDKGTIDDSVSQLYRNATGLAKQIQSTVSGLLTSATDKINSILGAVDSAFGAMKTIGGDDQTLSSPEHPALRQPDHAADSNDGSGDSKDDGNDKSAKDGGDNHHDSEHSHGNHSGSDTDTGDGNDSSDDGESTGDRRDGAAKTGADSTGNHPDSGSGTGNSSGSGSGSPHSAAPPTGTGAVPTTSTNGAPATGHDTASPATGTDKPPKAGRGTSSSSQGAAPANGSAVPAPGEAGHGEPGRAGVR
ncbi:WXG100 family type VII secretion target, partial [Amycolatopsis sp. NPDC000740]|uniref:WXG100 family type VII secretion target n=1 Tax=Amycolatopsis sp. NPDC000740 TaxID=3154269 RepID=UPI00331C1C61